MDARLVVFCVISASLAWASESELKTARASLELSEAMKYKATAWPPPALDNRGGDHLWQITINVMDAAKGRAMTEAEQHALSSLVAFDDLWIAAGRAGDRLRSLRQ